MLSIKMADRFADLGAARRGPQRELAGELAAEQGFVQELVVVRRQRLERGAIETVLAGGAVGGVRVICAVRPSGFQLTAASHFVHRLTC